MYRKYCYTQNFLKKYCYIHNFLKKIYLNPKFSVQYPVIPKIIFLLHKSFYYTNFKISIFFCWVTYLYLFFFSSDFSFKIVQHFRMFCMTMAISKMAQISKLFNLALVHMCYIVL